MALSFALFVFRYILYARILLTIHELGLTEKGNYYIVNLLFTIFIVLLKNPYHFK